MSDDGFLVSFDPEPPKQHHRSSMSEWGPPVLTFVGGLLTAVPALAGLSTRYPALAKWLMILGGLVIAGVVVFYLGKTTHLVLDKIAEHRYLRIQERKLRDLVSHFKPFVANENSMSLRGILRSINDEATAKLMAPECSDLWAASLQMQLETPALSLRILANRAREFSLLVNDFVFSQAQRLQREITVNNKSIHSSYVDMLEEFREDLNAFIRELEQWTGPFNEYVIPRIGSHALPNSKFQKVKTFKRSNTAES